MERNEDYVELESEDFPDEFQCCVCLDIIYKPVVLACGHISCFWCVFRAMNSAQESRCPVCREPYNHFPSICQLLHLLLLKLYPSTYKRREKQVTEEEKKYGHTSPQFEGSSFDKEIYDKEVCSPLPTATVDKSITKFQGHDSMTPNCTAEHKDANETLKQALISRLECDVCKKLFCRPVVLNCGHAYCETCVNIPHDSIYRCPGCQLSHPNGFPNVCLVLKNFLEQHFPEEYLAREESLAKVQQPSSPGCSTGNQDHAGKEGRKQSKVPIDVYSSWRSSSSGDGPKVHPGVGCDYCGMYPIIGQRYRCKDCVEKIGFDLCEGCFNSSFKLPGRFNQQHTQEHKFEIIEPPYLQHIIMSLGRQYGD